MNRKKESIKGQSSDITQLEQDSDYELFSTLAKKLQTKYDLDLSQLILNLDNKELLVPTCIFSDKLSAFESIVKYLKENLHQSNKDLAVALHKSQKSIWQCYRNARQKHPSPFLITPCDEYIPLSAMNPKLTTLESIVVYLKQHNTLHEIAQILKRNDRTIWTVHNRARKKL